MALKNNIDNIYRVYGRQCFSWHHLFRAGAGRTREKCYRHKISTADHAFREFPLSRAISTVWSLTCRLVCIDSLFLAHCSSSRCCKGFRANCTLVCCDVGAHLSWWRDFHCRHTGGLDVLKNLVKYSWAACCSSVGMTSSNARSASCGSKKVQQHLWSTGGRPRSRML